jgi:ribosomal protein S18 acetylase RimI-like enzyme
MIAIERAKSEDVDLINQLLTKTWIDTYGAYLSPSTIEQVTTNWHHPKLLRSQIEKSGDYFAVAKDEGRIIGLITVIVTGENELYLPRLYVHPDYQRQGVGSKLLNAAIASYPDATLIRLEVEQQNAKGYSYWRKQQFMDVGTSIEQIGTDRIAVISMERRLR